MCRIYDYLGPKHFDHIISSKTFFSPKTNLDPKLIFTKDFHRQNLFTRIFSSLKNL